MFSWNVSRVIKRGGIIADTSPPIDHVLSEDLVRKIYDTWDEKVDGPMMDYGGGVRAITAMMVREAGIEFLSRIRHVGPKRADEILRQIGDTLEIPYYGDNPDRI